MRYKKKTCDGRCKFIFNLYQKHISFYKKQNLKTVFKYDLLEQYISAPIRSDPFGASKAAPGAFTHRCSSGSMEANTEGVLHAPY